MRLSPKLSLDFTFQTKEITYDYLCHHRPRFKLHQSWVRANPLEFQTKRPINPNWPELAISEVNIGDYFNGNPANIGILMGKPSGGLVDIDIDNTDALKFADRFMPKTNCIFGRQSKPRSHRIYKVRDAGRRETFDVNGMIAEIRGNGCCTVFPGSVHPSGEVVEFDNPMDFTPASSTWDELKKAVQKMAIGALLHQHWCPGHRHDLALSVTALLARQGWDREDVSELIEAVATESQDEDLKDRLACVETTFVKHSSGQVISSDSGLMASIPMQSLMEQRYGSQQTNDLAHLVGKRLVTASEGERGQKLAESKIKMMTGEDVLSCRHLYRDLFNYKPQFKLWLATNTLPTIVGTDEAIWRRIRVIPFSVTIPPDEQDKTLATRLAAELPGILNWALDGWKLWKEGGLKPPDQVVQSTGNYRTDEQLGRAVDRCRLRHRTGAKHEHEGATLIVQFVVRK